MAAPDHAALGRPYNLPDRIPIGVLAARSGVSTSALRFGLPADRAPAKADWARLSRAWRPRLDARITELEKLRDELTGCIGGGCLSLRTCRLVNRDDVAAAEGAGSYLRSDRG